MILISLNWFPSGNPQEIQANFQQRNELFQTFNSSKTLLINYAKRRWECYCVLVNIKGIFSTLSCMKDPRFPMWLKSGKLPYYTLSPCFRRNKIRYFKLYTTPNTTYNYRSFTNRWKIKYSYICFRIICVFCTTAVESLSIACTIVNTIRL